LVLTSSVEFMGVKSLSKLDVSSAAEIAYFAAER
jgi:hypothetical protein